MTTALVTFTVGLVIGYMIYTIMSWWMDKND